MIRVTADNIEETDRSDYAYHTMKWIKLFGAYDILFVKANDQAMAGTKWEGTLRARYYDLKVSKWSIENVAKEIQRALKKDDIRRSVIRTILARKNS